MFAYISVYSIEYPLYEFEEVKRLPMGEQGNTLGYLDTKRPMLEPLKPSCMEFTDSNQLFISDPLNQSFVIISSNFDQITRFNLKSSYDLYSSYNFFISGNFSDRI